MDTGTLDGAGAETTPRSGSGDDTSSSSGGVWGPGSSDAGPATSTSTSDGPPPTGGDAPPEVSGTGELICTLEYQPVCGRDGETYDHPCDAIIAGVEIRREGPCFGDCEGSCSVSGSPLTSALVLALLLAARPRRGRRSGSSLP